MPVRARGASTLRTLGAIRASGVHSNERHVHQFQIASLELERSRREREKEAAMNRIKALDERVTEIDRLIRGHLEALGTPVYAVSIQNGGMNSGQNMVPNPAQEKRRMLRY